MRKSSYYQTGRTSMVQQSDFDTTAAMSPYIDYVIIRIYIGVIVLVIPWYAPLWADNQLLSYFPRVGTFLMYGAVRGMVSGLGLLNLWIALVEAVHYRASSS